MFSDASFGRVSGVLSGGNTDGVRAWFSDDAPRGGVAGIPGRLLLLGAVFCWLSWCGLPAAQAQLGLARPVLADTVADDDGREAHRLVMQWLREDLVDRVAAPTMLRPDVVAVAVTVRRRGVVVGLGESVRGDLTADVMPEAQPVDLTNLLAEAAEAAFQETRRKLKLNPAGSDPLLGDRLNDVAGLLLIDVQIARGLTPIRIAADDPVFAVLDRYAPGYHGLRLSGEGGDGGGEAAKQWFAWPALSLQSNSAGERELRRLAVAAGDQPEAWLKYGRPERRALQRFDVLHVVKPSKFLPAEVLVRGQRVLPVNAVRRPTLVDMGERMALHLYRHLSEEGVVSGVYLPTSGRHESAQLHDPGAAFVCYALARFANESGHEPGEGSFHNSDRLATRTQALATRLAKQVQDDPASQPVVSALLLLAMTDAGLEIPGLSAAHLIQGLLSLHDADRGFMSAPAPAPAQAVASGNLQPLPLSLQALLAASLASVYAQTPDETLAGVIASSWVTGWQTAWAQVEANPDRMHDLVDPFAWSWLSLIESRAGAGLLAAGVLDQASHDNLLEAMAVQMDEASVIQVQSLPKLGPRDVYGGFLIEGFASTAPPMPDWRSAQVLFAMAAAQQSDGLMQREGVDFLGWRFSAELGARFVGQLTMDEWAGFYCSVPGQAVGGVRQSVIDNRLDPTAAAMGLIAINELLKTKAGQ